MGGVPNVRTWVDMAFPREVHKKAIHMKCIIMVGSTYTYFADVWYLLTTSTTVLGQQLGLDGCH